eukprot:GHRR01011524.1.p1 GENE.GHRR01011524.1~~GHRR01011524.1.p1  ORF type:complete len:182 (+),score=57.23 GHRR01011524.1:272-817(+)
MSLRWPLTARNICGAAGRERMSSAACITQQQAAAEADAGQQAVKVVLVVAVALIDNQSRVLLAQRPAGKPMAGLWEFPGGKIDPGETPEAALVRELREELNIQVVTQALQPLTFASHTYDTFHLVMPLYVCRKWSGQLHGLEGQQMAWVAEQQMQDYAMPAADVPLVGPVLQAMRTAIVDS